MNGRLLVCSFVLHGAAVTAAGAWMLGGRVAPASRTMLIAVLPAQPAPAPEFLPEPRAADPLRAAARPLPEPPLPLEPTTPDDDFTDLEPARRPMAEPTERREAKIGESAFVSLRAPEPTPLPEPTPPPEPPPSPEPPAVKIDAAVLDGFNAPPRYPMLARRAKLEGSVLLHFRISRDGHIQHVEVRTSSGHALLDEAALAAVRTWRFSPARRGNALIEDAIDQEIVFRLP